VAPGTYLLRSEVDPENVVAESDESNPPSTVPVRIPGHVARPVAAPRTVELRADRVEPMRDTLGPPEYKILGAPKHGIVDRAIGRWSSDPVVTYTPADPANPQPDAVQYVARAAGSAFPVDPPQATASFGQGRRRHDQRGARDHGRGHRRHAACRRAGHLVGVGGPHRPDGTFTAPDAPGDVRIRAVTAGGSAAVARIGVVAPPAREAAPLPVGAPPGDPAVVPSRPLAPTPPVGLPRKALVSARAQRMGRFVAVSVVPGRPGTLRFVLRRGARTGRPLPGARHAGPLGHLPAAASARGKGALRVVVQLLEGRAKPVSRTVAVRSGHVH
jgi:hypothetical protein